MSTTKKAIDMIIGIVCIVLTFIVIAIAVHLLIPLPILSYDQGNGVTQQGEVTEVKKIRPGVIEVSITKPLEIDPRLQEVTAQGDTIGVTQASFTSFIHFRGRVGIPKIGDKIWVVSVNRLHLFTGRSFNWVKKWVVLKGDSQVGGKVELCSTTE